MPEPPDDELTTVELRDWVAELRAGRPHAAERTLRKVVARVEELARGMFKKFPRVGRFVDADDVVQSSLVRLLRALREVRPESSRHFYALANGLIRRELLDLCKHYYGPRGHGTNLSDTPDGADFTAVPTADPDARELERGATFHEAVERLPVEQREAFGLVYYHGWTQEAIADLFGVSVRTVQRWLSDAMAALQDVFGEK